MPLALHELDPVIDEIRAEVLDLLLRQLHFLDTRHDLVVGEEALLDAVRNELMKLFDVRQMSTVSTLPRLSRARR